MRARTVLWAGVSCGIAVAAIAAGPLRRHARGAAAATVRAPAEALPDPLRWPGDGAWLMPPEPRFAEGRGPFRVVIDPGHGAPGNRGNTSCFCVDEQDAMLDL